MKLLKQLKLINVDDFKTRLIEEKTQLAEKIDRLKAFLGSESSKEVKAHQMSLLRIQYTAMCTYHDCLTERLSTLP